MVAHGADVALDRLLYLGNDMLEVLLAVLAQRADKVVGQLASLVEVAADLAEVTLDRCGYTLLLLANGVLFVVPLQVKKPSKTGLAAMLVIGIVCTALIIIFK